MAWCIKGIGKQRVGKQTSGQNIKGENRFETARTSSYHQSAVGRPCGITLHATLQNKSVVCSGSRVTISTVMKLAVDLLTGAGLL